MNVLFVAGGNSGGSGLSQLILAQGRSLECLGLNVKYFPIKGKGALGYFKNINKLRKSVRNNSIDIVHAHFSYSGVISSLTNTGIPCVVSFLGSDVYGRRAVNGIILKLHRFLRWDAIIVKSADMALSIQGTKPFIIPNGVDLNKFEPMDTSVCKAKLGWDLSGKCILFAANPERYEKNFNLAEKALSLCAPGRYYIKHLWQVDHSDMPIWINAADVVLLTSLWEGSPNVIKEAMACNRPLVATDVGDIRWLFGNLPGHYIAGFTPEDVCRKIIDALIFSENMAVTNGRDRIIKLGLDSMSIAKRIVDIYNYVLASSQKSAIFHR